MDAKPIIPEDGDSRDNPAGNRLKKGKNGDPIFPLTTHDFFSYIATL
jgi:hypothetical protein